MAGSSAHAASPWIDSGFLNGRQSSNGARNFQPREPRVMNGSIVREKVLGRKKIYIAGLFANGEPTIVPTNG